MRSLGWIAALWIALSVAAPAAAKDVCVGSSAGASFRFKKVKSLKKPGSVQLLQGWAALGSNAYPLAGAAVVRDDGNVAFGIQVFSLAPGFFEFVGTLVGDASFAGSGQFRNAGGDPADWTWTPLDCDDLPIP